MKLRNAAKKVAAVTTGVTMLGATLTGAMAAADLSDYPAPFVSDGRFDGFFVVGEAAATADVLGSVDIATSLQASAVTQDVVDIPGQHEQTVIGDGVAYSSGTRQLGFGDSLSDVRQTITENELPVLRTTQVTDEDGSQFDVRMRVYSPNANVSYDRAVLDLDSPDFIIDVDGASYGLEVFFPTPVNISKLRGETLSLFGQEFTVGESSGEVSNQNQVLTLYRAGLVQTIQAGETVTVSTDSGDMTVEVVGVNLGADGGAQATVVINGQLRTFQTGTSRTVSGERFFAKNVVGYDQPVGGGMIELFIGSQKIVLTDGEEVEGDGNDVIQGTMVTYSGGGANKVSAIRVDVTPSSQDVDGDPVRALQRGDELVDPVFGALKFAFTDAVPGLTADSRDHVEVRPAADDRLNLRFTNRNGESYNVEILRGVVDGANDTLVARYGSDSTDYLRVYNLDEYTGGTPHLELNQGNRFILTYREHTRILEVQTVRDSANVKELRLRDVGSSNTQTWGADADGVGTFTYDGATVNFNITSSTTFNVTDATSGATVGAREIMTRNGGMLTIADDTTGSATGATAQWSFTENTQYSYDSSPDEHGVVLFNVTYDSDASNREIGVRSGDVAYDGTTSGDWSGLLDDADATDMRRAITPYGSYVVHNQAASSRQLDLYYPREEMFFNVFLAPVGAEATPGIGEGTVVSERVQRINVGAAILDRDAEALLGSENLIVVGGPCGNTVAAQLMGNPADCTEGFERGRAMIKLFESDTGHVSMLVAGFTADDTRLASQVVANYDQYRAELQGSEVEVSGQSINNVVISAPTVNDWDDDWDDDDDWDEENDL